MQKEVTNKKVKKLTLNPSLLLITEIRHNKQYLFTYDYDVFEGEYKSAKYIEIDYINGRISKLLVHQYDDKKYTYEETGEVPITVSTEFKELLLLLKLDNRIISKYDAYKPWTVFEDEDQKLYQRDEYGNVHDMKTLHPMI